MNGKERLTDDASSEEEEIRYHKVDLPRLRFLHFIILLLVADFLVSTISWLADGDSEYMKHGIFHFNITRSVFDLAIINILSVAILIPMFIKLEDLTVKAARSPYSQADLRKRLYLFAITFLLLLGRFAFSLTKGILVFLKYKDNNSLMHTAYYIVCISSLSFGTVEICVYIWNVFVLRRLRVAVAKTSLEDGESSSADGKDKEPPKKVDLRRLTLLAREEWDLIFFGILGLIGSSAVSIAAPLYFGKVIDAAREHSMSKLNNTILILFLMYVGGGVAAFFRSWLFTLAGQKFVARLRKKVFDHILRQEIAFFDQNRTGELMNRLASDSEVIQNAVTVNISMLFRYLVQIIGSLAVMFGVSPKLTAVLIAVVPLVAVGAQQYGRYVQNIRKMFQDELAKAANTAEESIGNIRTVRSFSQETKSCRLYGDDIDKSYSLGKKLSLSSGVFNAGMSIIAQGAVVLVLWYGGKLVNDGSMSVGTLTAFMIYALQVAMAFAFLSSLYGDFMQAVGASIRIFNLLDRKPSIEPGSSSLPTMEGVELKFENVDFSYPSRPDTSVLKGLSFGILPGETVALVGPSGGGKSTIISLIERFYDPLEGRVLVGDLDLTTVDPVWYRQKVGIVSQEPVLFATTIKDNIAYGRDAKIEEIMEAAKQSNAHSFILDFEDGYDTTVGERGIKLSGGQKQRVAIARALLMDPDILLLDEATSALDAESEHLVKEAIDRAMEGRTVLVIAHRLSTVRNASKVVVIDKGSIAEVGTHEELIERGGVYKKLVLRQLNAAESDAADRELIGGSTGEDST